MNIWLDNKYVNLLSSRLRNFKSKGTYNYNFSCPYCGDSKKNKTKARAYVFQKNGNLNYYCHNCNIPGVNVEKLVKFMDPSLHSEYIKEKLEDRNKPANTVTVIDKKFQFQVPSFQTNSALKDCQKISALKPSHKAKKWIMSRKIPSKFHYKLYYTSKFKEWTNQQLPGKFESVDYDEPRIIIPFLDKNDNMFGFQGRALYNNDFKYITIILDDNPAIYGLDTVDLTDTVYVTEGPIDSMFINNSIAMCGGSIIGDLDSLECDKSNFVIVYDNEPRSKYTIKKIEKAIENHYKVCVWPAYIEYKDINDMVLAGLTPKRIKSIIEENTFAGLEASVRLQMWRKII